MDNENLNGKLQEVETISGSLSGTQELKGTVQEEGEQLLGKLCIETLRGYSIQYVWDGTKLGIKTEDQDEYQFVDLGGVSPEIEITKDGDKTIVTFIDVNGTQTIEFVDSSDLNDKVNKYISTNDETVSEIDKKVSTNNESIDKINTSLNNVKNDIDSVGHITNEDIKNILNM